MQPRKWERTRLKEVLLHVLRNLTKLRVARRKKRTQVILVKGKVPFE